MTKIDFNSYTEKVEIMIIMILVKLGAKMGTVEGREYWINMEDTEVAEVVNFFHELNMLNLTIE